MAKVSCSLILTDLKRQDACPKAISHPYVVYPVNTSKAPAI